MTTDHLISDKLNLVILGLTLNTCVREESNVQSCVSCEWLLFGL